MSHTTTVEADTVEQADETESTACSVCGLGGVETRELAYNPRIEGEEIPLSACHEIWTELRDAVSDPNADPHGRGKRWTGAIETIQSELSRPVELRTDGEMDVCARCMAILTDTDLDEEYPQFGEVQFAGESSMDVEYVSPVVAEDEETGSEQTGISPKNFWLGIGSVLFIASVFAATGSLLAISIMSFLAFAISLAYGVFG